MALLETEHPEGSAEALLAASIKDATTRAGFATIQAESAETEAATLRALASRLHGMATSYVAALERLTGGRT